MLVRATSTYARTFVKFFLSPLTVCAILASCVSNPASAQEPRVPKPPAPEPIEVTELPFPPTAPSSSPGACDATVNPNRTGCLTSAPLSFQSGSFLPDGHHVLALGPFRGAPEAPEPASNYQGGQIIIVKTDGTRVLQW